MATKKKSSPRKSSMSRSKVKAVASHGRQFYSEIAGAKKSSAKKPASSKSKPSATKRSSKKAAPTRELLSEITKVGRSIKRRVKRAL